MPVTFGAEIKEGKVYRGKKRTEDEEEKRALAELQSLLNAKNRRACDCEAQLHDLLENCLSCDQAQRERLKKYVDLSYSYPTVGEQKAKQSNKSSVKIIDNQFDQFAIENQRHLREQDKQKLRETLDDLQSKRYQTKLVLDVDLDNMQAGTSTAPVIDDYTKEIRKLQISEPSEQTQSGPSLVEFLNKKALENKKSSNVQSPTKDQTKNKKKPQQQTNKDKQ